MARVSPLTRENLSSLAAENSQVLPEKIAALMSAHQHAEVQKTAAEIAAIRESVMQDCMCKSIAHYMHMRQSKKYVMQDT